MRESGVDGVRAALSAAGVELTGGDTVTDGPGVICFSSITDELMGLLHDIRRSGALVLALATSSAPLQAGGTWRLLHAGAADTIAWTEDGAAARQIRARVQRWREVDELISDAAETVPLIGSGPGWRDFLRRVVEAARFTDSPILLIGESGTGKELLAQLVHVVDSRGQGPRAARDLVTVDCSTIVPELSGSELFGHEKGAFTGAVGPREGALSLADDGTLFLDEIGELPLGLQSQLLRAVQEKTYKRVGGNVWQATDFRLVSATNRDLAELVERGQFRLDLYHRLAGWVFRLPPLRERREDILPLAAHFLETARPDGDPLEFDGPVSEYLLNREYRGNIRELRQLVFRIAHRHVGPGPITAGDIPPEDRPAGEELQRAWPDDRLDRVIEDAITLGVGLKEISQATVEAAIRIAVQSEKGNLQRAARRLGVTDRALQMRRASKKVGTSGAG